MRSQFTLIIFLWIYLYSIFDTIVKAQQVDTTKLNDFYQKLLQENDIKENIASISFTIGDSTNILFSNCTLFQKPDQICDPEKALFQIGQISKLISRTIALKELNNFNYTKPLEDYFSSSQSIIFPDNIIGDFESFNRLPLNDAKEKVILQDLFIDTHGFDQFDLGDHAKTEESMLKELKDYFQKGKKFVRVRQRGEIVTTNNVALALLAYLTELTKNDSFENILKQSLLNPLDMNNTYYQINSQLRNLPDFVDLVMKVNGNFKKQYPIYQNFAPAMGMVSTTKDLTKFLQLFLENKDQNILSQQVLDLLKNRKFSYNSKAPGMTYGWKEEIYNGETYLILNGRNGPHYTLVAVFPKLTFAISASGGLPTNEILEDTLHRFINTFVKKFECVNSPFRIDPSTGKCLMSQSISNLKLLDQFDSKLESKLGCFIPYYYEHTTWFKIQKLLLPQICVSKITERYLIVQEENTEYYLALDNDDVLRPGLLERDEFLFQYPFDKAYGFINRDDIARYMYINQQAFEIEKTKSFVWKVLICIYLITIIPGSIISFLFTALLFVEFCIVYKETRKDGKEYYAINVKYGSKWEQDESEVEYHLESVAQDIKENDNTDDDVSSSSTLDEIQLPDAYSAPVTKKKLPRLSFRKRFIIACIFDGFSQIILILTMIILFLHIFIISFSLASYNITDVLTETSTEVKFGLSLPIVMLGLLIIGMISFLCVFFNRVFTKSSTNGCIWILYLGFMLILISTYIPIAVYWNLFGF